MFKKATIFPLFIVVLVAVLVLSPVTSLGGLQDILHLLQRNRAEPHAGGVRHLQLRSASGRQRAVSDALRRRGVHPYGHPSDGVRAFQVLTKIWGYDFDGETRTVDVHIRTLRQKLGDAGKMIETVRGVGYRIGKGTEAIGEGSEQR